MLTFAIIGAGRIGRVHAGAVADHPEARLIAISDPMESAGRELATAHEAHYFADAADAIDAADAVVICSPTALHVDHLRLAVSAGKPVMCEKPVDLDIRRAQALADELADTPHTIMLGFNRRFDPTFSSMRARVNAGEIGDLQQLTIVSRDPAPPPVDYLAGSGGIFRDMTIHDFDTARFFLGDIVEVSAAGQQLDPAVAAVGDYDAAVVTLRAATGALAIVVNSRHCASGYDQRIEAFGPKGTLAADNIHHDGVLLHSGTVTMARTPYLDFFLERYAAAYRRELGEFIDAVQASRTPTPTLADGIAALRIADAATVSAQQGRPVSLV